MPPGAPDHSGAIHSLQAQASEGRSSVVRVLKRLKYILNILTCVALFYLALWGVLEKSLYPKGENYQLTGLTVVLTVGFLVGELTTITKLPNIVGE